MKTSISKRFWDKTVPIPECGCFIWTGAILKSGYGVFDSDRTRLAHRVSWELTNGPIPDGMQILHSCDTPSCVNPHHLSLGTQKKNISDAVKRERMKDNYPHPKGVNHSGARLNDAIVKKILDSTESCAFLSRIYGVSTSTIFRIRKRMSWKHVL
jgi:hypothetical protein